MLLPQAEAATGISRSGRSMTMKLIPFLGFDGQAHEAMVFYARAFGGRVV